MDFFSHPFMGRFPCSMTHSPLIRPLPHHLKPWTMMFLSISKTGAHSTNSRSSLKMVKSTLTFFAPFLKCKTCLCSAKLVALKNSRSLQRKMNFSIKETNTDEKEAVLLKYGCECVKRAEKWQRGSAAKRTRSQKAKDVSQVFPLSSSSSPHSACQGNEGCTNRPRSFETICDSCQRLATVEIKAEETQVCTQKILSKIDPDGEDTAYWHPRRGSEVFSPGDIIGLFNDTVTREVTKCTFISAIPQKPMQKRGKEGPNNSLVAYMGQVNVLVNRVANSSLSLDSVAYVVVASGKNDCKGRLLPASSPASELSLFIGDFIRFPALKDTGPPPVGFMWVRIRIHGLSRVHPSSPEPSYSSSSTSPKDHGLPKPARSSKISDPRARTDFTSKPDWKPSPKFVPYRVSLLNEARKLFGCTPKVQCFSQASKSGTNGCYIFGVSRLNLLDPAGNIIFSCDAPVSSYHTSLGDAEDESCAMALVEILKFSPPGAAGNGSSSVVPVKPVVFVPQHKITLQNEAQKRYLCTVKIKFVSQESNSGPNCTSLFGISRLSILEPSGRPLFYCETPVPLIHSTLKAAEDASCKIALESILKRPLPNPTIVSLSRFSPTLSPKVFSSVPSSVSFPSFSPKASSSAPSKISSSSVPSRIPSKVSELKILNPAGQVIFSCPTPVPTIHSTLKAAEDASCKIALKQLRR